VSGFVKTILKFGFAVGQSDVSPQRRTTALYSKRQGANTGLKTGYSDFLLLFSFPADNIRDISPV
jgi:hypothetical protein